MTGWHHPLNGREFGQTLGYSEGQESLVCCSPWDCKELDTTWQQNNNSKKVTVRTRAFLVAFKMALLPVIRDLTQQRNRLTQ